MQGRDPPQVTVAGFEPLEGQGMELRLNVKLRVQNPNDSPIDYNGVSVQMNVQGKSLATGVSPASGSVPRFVWITPGLCNDGHDCSTAVSDRYLSQVVPLITSTPAWQDHGVLFITWDEGEDAYNHVLTLVITPGGRPAHSSLYHDHYSLLATIEDRFGLPRLGQAAHATSLRELLVSGSAA